MSHKIERHTWGLREALFREWEDMRRGHITPQRAAASAKMAQAILKSVEVEIAYVQHVRKAKDGELTAISAHVRLGNP
jgi:hypothetical protein